MMKLRFTFPGVTSNQAIHLDWRRILLSVWFCLCVVVALNAALQMFTAFAPRHAESAEAREVELESIERVRRFWLRSVFLCSGVLVVTSGVLVVAGWRSAAKPPGTLDR